MTVYLQQKNQSKSYLYVSAYLPIPSAFPVTLLSQKSYILFGLKQKKIDIYKIEIVHTEL